MDLSEGLDCIPHDLLIPKLHEYRFSSQSLTFFYSYLKRRKQSVKLNNTHSVFQVLLSSVPQSILGPTFFNIFINDLFYRFKDSELHNSADDNTISSEPHNLADDNTISSAEFSVEKLLKTLERES